MAKKGSYGEYICDHCGSTSMKRIKEVNKGGGTIRIILECNNCHNEDYYDSCGN